MKFYDKFSITHQDIDEYWENSPQWFFNLYTRLKNEVGRDEKDIEWNIRNALLVQWQERLFRKQ